MELFLYFFDILVGELLMLFEESRTIKMILGALNSTFITLVPKTNK